MKHRPLDKTGSTHGSIHFSREYWFVRSSYKTRPDESELERRERRKGEREKLKAAGFRTEYNFTRKVDANAIVRDIKKKTGVILEVSRGFMMGF